MKRLFFYVLLAVLCSSTYIIEAQELGCAMPDPTSDPDNGQYIGVRQSCRRYSGSNDYFMPNPNTNPLHLKVNFIFITDTDPNEPKNFDQNDPLHVAFIDQLVSRTAGRVQNFQSFCPQGQIGQCEGADDGCCNKNAPNAATCPCDNCPDLGPDWIRDPKIRFDISTHWISDPTLWDNDPDMDTDATNCDDPRLPNSDFSTHTCPGGTNWYLHNFDLGIHDNCNVNPPVPRGINLYFTVDGNAYEEMVVNQSTNVSYCGLACATRPSESDLNKFAREHMPNVFLKYYEHRDSSGALDNISWEFARSIVHEIGHNFDLNHKDDCSCYLMKTQACGTKNMIEEDELLKIHRSLALSNVRSLVKCAPLAAYDDAATDQDVLRITGEETWNFDMKVYKHIVVETGGRLTVTCRLLMPQGGQIIVKRGAELVVDGGVISHERSAPNSCGDTYWADCEGGYWDGIEVWGRAEVPQALGQTASFPGVVRLVNDALLERAATGIMTKRRDVGWPEERDYWGGIVIAENSTFSDNLRSAEFMKYDFHNLSRFTGCTFQSADPDTWAGVTMWATKGIEFEQCSFDQMGQKCIGLFDASAAIFNSCSFTNSSIGVEVLSSMPLPRTVNVGMPSGAGRNYFSGLNRGISATAGKLVGVYHNDFVENSFGVYANGDSWFEVTNNQFDKQLIAIASQQTQDNPNLTLCNKHDDINTGVRIEGNNSGFQFIQENYDEGAGADNSVQIVPLISSSPNDPIINGSVLNPQGYFNAPVFNLFSSNGSHINAPIQSNTDFFFYFHPAPYDPRLKPDCDIDDGCFVPNNFRNLVQPGQESGCLSEEVFRYEECPKGDIHCLEYLGNKIDTLSQWLAQAPIEDRTSFSKNDSVKFQLAHLQVKRQHLLQSMVKNYTDQADYQALEQLLVAEQSDYGQKGLIALKLQTEDFAAAQSLIQVLPEQTTEEAEYKYLQNLNLARLSTDFGLDSIQEVTLYQIAENSAYHRGYAQSLLIYLTRAVFIPEIEETSQRQSKVRYALTDDVNALQLIPNPANKQVSIKLHPTVPHDNWQMNVYDITGRLRKEVALQQQRRYLLDTNDLENGTFIIKLYNEQKVSYTAKLMIVR